MGLALAIEQTNLSRCGIVSAESHEVMAAKFHQLLNADKQSPEFLELWNDLDAYLSVAVENERSC